MVEIFTAPFVAVKSEGADKCYGHGIWIRKGDTPDTEVYLEGSDAGVSFYSGVIRSKDLLVTVVSNTTEGVWPILRAFDEILDD